jgi:hypothetical protein
MDPIGYISIAGGLFTLVAAAGDWDWFMNHPKARLFCSIFGRSGARVFYAILGIGLVVLGALMLAGVIHDKK